MSELDDLRAHYQQAIADYQVGIGEWKVRAEAAEAKVAAVEALIARTRKRGAPYQTFVLVSDLAETLASVGRTEPEPGACTCRPSDDVGHDGDCGVWAKGTVPWRTEPAPEAESR